jgi:hypothetical protein
MKHGTIPEFHIYFRHLIHSLIPTYEKKIEMLQVILKSDSVILLRFVLLVHQYYIN